MECEKPEKLVPGEIQLTSSYVENLANPLCSPTERKGDTGKRCLHKFAALQTYGNFVGKESDRDSNTGVLP